MKKYILSFLIFSSIVTKINAQLNPDPSSACNGSTSSTNVLRFGSSSGEGILSNRVSNSNGNQDGLDFFTNSIVRMRINGNANNANGYISIGSYATPSTPLSFGPYTTGTNPLRLSIFDDAVNPYGLGYYVSGSSRIFSFNVGVNTNSRFGFYDGYTVSGGTNGNEFVTFNAPNRSVGINNISPGAYLHVVNPNSSGGSTVIFESGGTNTARLLFTNANVYGAKNYIDGYNYSSSTTSAPMYFQALSGGFVGIGSFPYASSINSFAPTSLLHVQTGNIQVSNSGIPSLTKTGISMGAVGNNTANNATDYSWIQASSGPLVLNPLGTNSMTTGSTQNNNYVAIGFTPPGSTNVVPAGYNLLVQGKIMCEELKIKLKASNGWYDYVLKPGYKLMALDSLQEYINQNSHLPDIPSAKQVEEEGVMSGEMSGLLLKKVEELTLYVIEQNKNLSNQEVQIELLKKQNELLAQQVALLAKQSKKRK